MNRCREKKRGKGRVGEKVDTSNYNKRLNQLQSNCSEYECDIIERGGKTMATWNNKWRERQKETDRLRDGGIILGVDRCFHTYILNSNNFIIFHLIWYRVAHCLENTEYGRHGLDWKVRVCCTCVWDTDNQGISIQKHRKRRLMD